MTSKIRILHCIETIASGGVEQTLLTLIKGLDQNKYHHRIICTWAGGPVAAAFENEGVEIIAVGGFSNPFEFKKYWKVLQVIKEYKPQIIHGAVFEGMSMATVGKVFGGVRFLVLEETSDPQNRSRKANWLLWLFSLFADRFQAISEDVGDYLIYETKVNPKKLAVIPNGVSIPISASEDEILELKSDFGIKNEDFIVGFVGRLFNGHKRVTDLVEAISLLQNPAIKLLIVGDGKDKELIQFKVKELGLEKNVIFSGYHADLSIYYGIMDILCVPSSREGFGLVAVEGMFHNLPLIVSKVGGLQDIVIEGETGFLIPPLDPRAIASKIQVLLDNPDLRESMGAKGRLRALENYTAKRYCGEVEDLYLELIRKKIKNDQ